MTAAAAGGTLGAPTVGGFQDGRGEKSSGIEQASHALQNLDGGAEQNATAAEQMTVTATGPRSRSSSSTSSSANRRDNVGLRCAVTKSIAQVSKPS